MLTCSACLRKALQNLASDLPSNAILIHDQPSVLSRSVSLVKRLSAQRRLHQQRNHATLASLKRGHHRRDLIRLNQKSKSKNSPIGKERRKAPWALTGTEIRDARARDTNRAWFEDGNVRRETVQEAEENKNAENEEDEEELVRPSEIKEPTKSEQKDALKAKQKLEGQRRKELRLMRKDQKEVETYFKDPIQLASAVLQRLRLREPDIDGALRLVRASQPLGIKNIVSWNHCMDWLMMQGNVKHSIKVYNEMKKRGQMPDAHTYTIMLRGLSQHIKYPNAVKEAVKIYNSMFAPNSAVTPNTIHANAIINVCARGGDMESLWAVAGRLPEKGPGSPDRLTYTLILNAIRENTIAKVAKTADRVKFTGNAETAEEERKLMFQQAVADGRKMWEDVSFKWRRADLVIDEQLVCAMGRLLVGCGIGSDIEQVLDLVETTMNINIPERRGKAKSSLPSSKLETPNTQINGSGSARTLPLKDSSVYANPGQKTLSLLLEACYVHKPIQHLGSSYWHVLTDPNGPFNVKADAVNITAYLRILRVTRSSQKAYNLLAEQWPNDVAKMLYRRSNFVIAFSACARDRNNPNVFKTAQKMLQLMQDKLEEQQVGMFDESMALHDMNGREMKEARKKQKLEMKNLTQEEIEDYERQKEGFQSLALDPKVLKYFVQLAIDTTMGWNEGVRGKDEGHVFQRDPAKNHTMIALQKVGPLLGESKRLLKLKLDEARFGNHRDPSKSLVREKVEELLDLMRVVIGAYDKVIDIADRFKQFGRQPLDEELIQSYNSRKRECNAYMAKVERSLRIKLKEANALVDEDEVDDNVDGDEEGEPEISRRIKAVLEEVDSKIMRDRAIKKGHTLPNPTDKENLQLKIHSRKQEKERENLLNREIGRHFPDSDYGVLNEELEIEMGEASKARIQKYDQMRHPAAMDVNGRSVGRINRNHAQQKRSDRPPMIGDELGLDDEDDFDADEATEPVGRGQPDQHDIPFEPRIRKVADDERTMRTGDSILDRDEVRRAWSRSRRNLPEDVKPLQMTADVAAAASGSG